MNEPNKTAQQKITKKDLWAVNWRWALASQIQWNYERMESSGYLYSILPVLKKLYGHDKDKFREMMKAENQYYNTAASMGHIVLGLDIAVQEQEGIGAKDIVPGLKTGLMGPLAGVGDSMWGVIWGTIWGSLACAFAVKGSPVGVLMWLMANLCIYVPFRFWSIFAAYNQGVKLVTTMKDKLNAMTKSATMLGVMVVGAMIPTVVNAKVPFVYKNGGMKIVLQDMLDQIMPHLIPVCLVALAYWLLGRKHMNSNRVIWIMLGLSIVLYSLKILG
ncbi:PTS system mannose/fructose/sorbose family transporter subunit IID [Lacticaseibacillus absianus]|uniref:PTS system mannose/fructose/sorbose family transporter subunit IID n=1 Tax=Lacticaseibacillus absianus TaxID=2729623 RepID=UPI001FE32272|nr:PTS system mannose/fructose/sorbose family transporter subunit IID [Lacticaseibacillus absianus]